MRIFVDPILTGSARPPFRAAHETPQNITPAPGPFRSTAHPARETGRPLSPDQMRLRRATHFPVTGAPHPRLPSKTSQL